MTYVAEPYFEVAEQLLTGLYFVRVQQGDAVRVVRFTKQ